MQTAKKTNEVTTAALWRRVPSWMLNQADVFITDAAQAGEFSAELHFAQSEEGRDDLCKYLHSLGYRIQVHPTHLEVSWAGVAL